MRRRYGVDHDDTGTRLRVAALGTVRACLFLTAKGGVTLQGRRVHLRHVLDAYWTAGSGLSKSLLDPCWTRVGPVLDPYGLHPTVTLHPSTAYLVNSWALCEQLGIMRTLAAFWHP